MRRTYVPIVQPQVLDDRSRLKWKKKEHNAFYSHHGITGISIVLIIREREK